MKGNIKEAGTARSDELSEQQRLEFSSVIKINFSNAEVTGTPRRNRQKKTKNSGLAFPYLKETSLEAN